MTDAQLAHLRLLEQLKDKTRTHVLEPAQKQRGTRYTVQEKALLRRRLESYISKGWTRKEACRECGCTNKTLVSLLGNVPGRGRRRLCK